MLLRSTTSLTPFDSMTSSPAASASQNSMKYEFPEQPPPRTPMRRPTWGVPRPVSNSFTLSAATGVSAISFRAPFARSLQAPARAGALRIYRSECSSTWTSAGRGVRRAPSRAPLEPATRAGSRSPPRWCAAPHQLLLELLLAADVLARLVELGREERAQLRHGFRPAVGLPPALERLARLLERDAEPVQQVDPAHALDRLGVIEPEPAARSRRRLEQPPLLVKVDCAHGLARLASQVADAQIVRAVPVYGSDVVVVGHTLTHGLESTWNLLHWMSMGNGEGCCVFQGGEGFTGMGPGTSRLLTK